MMARAWRWRRKALGGGACSRAAFAAQASDLQRLSRPERSSRRAALANQIEQLAYLEEALVEQSQAAGAPVERSSSAPPAAVLGVRVIAEEARSGTRAA
jgi:hypothetical protein